MLVFEMNVEKLLFLFSTVIVRFYINIVVSVPINNVQKMQSVFPIPNHLSSNVIESVTSGAFLALEHCQSVFQWDRWNCPREEFASHTKQSANKEAAFTKAIIAAGIAYSITKNCSKGELKDCSCNPKLEGPLPQPPQYYNRNLLMQNLTLISGNILLNNTDSSRTKTDWSWGGCSDDPSFGAIIAKELLEDSEKKLTISAYVDRHNYKVGREIVRQSTVKKCRCHGVSGSCSLQICWMQLVPFQEVARRLRDKYSKAVRLTTAAVETSISLSNSIKREKKVGRLPARENVLVYLEQSPDYCIANNTQDWPGTKDRSCSRSKSDIATLSERRSCRNLCRQCGYKVRKERRTIKKRCNCTFKWCCEVKCDTCVETVEEFYCY